MRIRKVTRSSTKQPARLHIGPWSNILRLNLKRETITLPFETVSGFSVQVSVLTPNAASVECRVSSEIPSTLMPRPSPPDHWSLITDHLGLVEALNEIISTRLARPASAASAALITATNKIAQDTTSKPKERSVGIALLSVRPIIDRGFYGQARQKSKSQRLLNEDDFGAALHNTIIYGVEGAVGGIHS